jgi:hypothetical protein
VRQALGEIAGVARSPISELFSWTGTSNLEAVSLFVAVAAMNGMWTRRGQLSGSLTYIE